MDYEVKDFSVDILQASFTKPVLVDFWAEWCGPCRILGPILEQLAAKNNGAWNLVKVNSDEHPELSAEYGIRSIPNVKLFSNGKVINEFVGALSESMILDWLKKNIPSKHNELLQSAEKLLSSGKEHEAKKNLQDVLNKEPHNSFAKILLAKIILFQDHLKAVHLLGNIEETNDNAEIINSIRTIADLIEVDSNISHEDSGTKKIYQEAINYLRQKKYELSLQKFIEIIRTDRYFADDIARKACIAIFKLVGEENEITIAYRKEFGRALYV